MKKKEIEFIFLNYFVELFYSNAKPYESYKNGRKLFL